MNETYCFSILGVFAMNAMSVFVGIIMTRISQATKRKVTQWQPK